MSTEKTTFVRDEQDTIIARDVTEYKDDGSSITVREEGGMTGLGFERDRSVDRTRTVNEKDGTSHKAGFFE